VFPLWGLSVARTLSNSVVSEIALSCWPAKVSYLKTIAIQVLASRYISHRNDCLLNAFCHMSSSADTQHVSYLCLTALGHPR